MHSPLQHARFAIGVVLLLVAAGAAWRLVIELKTSQRDKIELAEIRHIRYGLLNANVWVEKIVPIVSKKIDEIDLIAANRTAIRHSVEGVLGKLIADVDKLVPVETAQPAGLFGSLTGGLKQALIKQMFDPASLKKRVPEFTDTVMKELGKPESRKAVQQYLRGVLTESSAKTFADVDMSVRSAILQRNGCARAEDCQQLLADRISGADTRIRSLTGLLLGSTIVAFALMLLPRTSRGPREMVLLLLFCGVLLLGGILTPMIEIEASISQLSFALIGEPIAFSNQVLYFQSKSIMDVVRLLMSYGALDMVFVAILVFLFSIAFPAAKLAASAVYAYAGPRVRRNALVNFFALKSGKWSMADVMVVALFMAYVGFNGLVSSQLADLRNASTSADILTTNGTALQAGFFVFLSFCLASLFLSAALDSTAPRPADE